MDEPHSSHWRQMFERGKPETPPGNGVGASSSGEHRAPPGGYDDGHAPPQGASSLLSPEEVSEEAALALGADTGEYHPWILQRGRSRPAIMLDLRRYEPRSALWCGWAVAYPQLVAVEYTGDRMVSLDFGGRVFMLEGRGLDELVRHLQQGTVLTVQEYAASLWPVRPSGPMVTAIRRAEPQEGP